MNDRLWILTVGADPPLSRGFPRLLREAGYQVLEATSGQQGLRLAVEHRPALLLVSVDLPDVDGIEFCRQLKADQALAGSLVVLLSAIKTSSEDQALALECGADGYIVQPIPNLVFLARVGAFLRLQRTMAERDAAHEALRESEDRYRAVSELTSDYAYAYRVEPDGELVNEWVTGALTRVTGYSDHELKSLGGWEHLVHPDDRTVALDQLRALLSNEAEIVEYRIVTKEGQVRWMQDSARPTWSATENRVTRIEGAVQDITERKRAEEERAHSQRLLLALGHAAQPVQRARTPDEVYQTIAESVEGLGYGATILTLNDERTQLGISHLALGPGLLQASEKLTGLSAEGYRFPVTPGGFFQQVIAGGETVFTQELDTTPFAEALPRLIRPLAGQITDLFGWRQAIFAPLTIGSEVHGLLIITGTSLSEADVPAITVFANQAAVAIENARLYTETQELAALNESVVQSIADGIVVQDADKVLTFVNPAAAELLGYAPDELVGKHWTAIIPPEQQSIVQAADERRIYGETDRYELELVRRDGRRIPVLVSGTPHFDSEGRFAGTMAVFTDITGRVRSEMALRESEERYRTFVQNFRGIAFRGRMDFTPVFFHGAVQEITGYTEREFLEGKPRWDQVVHPEDQRALQTEDEEKLYSTPDYSYEREYRVVRKDEKVRWVHETIQNVCDDSGKPVMVQGAIYDITERKRALEALRQEGDRAQKYLDIAGVMFVALDEKGVVTLINQKGADILGYEQREIVGKNWFDKFLPASVRDQVRTVFHRLMAGEIEPVEYHENPILTKGGEERTIAWHNTVLEDDEGNCSGILTSGEDITERVRAEHATRERQRYLEGVLSAAPDAIVTLDPQNRIEDWNSGAEWLFGYQRQETIGQDIDCLIARDEILEEALTFKRLVSGGRNLPPTETVRYRQDGSPVNVIVAGAPIVVDDELAGVVAIYTDITERKRAEEALQQRASQLALLNEIGRRVTAFLDLDEVLHRAAQLVQERFGFHHVGLFTKVAVENRMVMRARAGEFASLYPSDHSVGLGQGMVGWVGLHGETLLANDVEAEPHYINPYPDRLPTRSELSVPIRVGDEILGVLDLQSPEPNAFDPSDVTTNETLAGWLGGAIQNAGLFYETQQQLDDLGLLFAASVTFSISLDLDTVLETTARQITATLQADGCAISLWDREQDILVTMLDYTQDLDSLDGDPPGAIYPLADYPLSRRVLADRQLVTVQADDPAADPAEVAWMAAEGVKSLLMIPLIARDQAIGMLELMEVQEKRDFSSAEMRLVQTLANQTAAALENARLYDEARRRSRELALLNRVIAATAAGQEIEPILEVVCRELALAFDVPQSAAALFNPEKTEAVVVAEYRTEDRPSSLDDVIPMVGNPSIEWLLDHKAALVVEDAQNDPRMAPAHDLMRRRGTVSLLLLPLMVDGDVVGSLGVDAIEPRSITSEEVNLASRVAEQVSSVLARARLREEHQRMEEQFHQAQKMEAVGRLAGGVAHDFNNLLTVIHLSARLLERKLRPEDPLWPHVQRVQDASQRAAGLTRQLLAFSRQEIIEPQVLNLNQVLGELDKMLRRIIGEDVDLTLLPAGELWPTKIDPTQVEQIVINLAVNARDAMPDGGKLTMETANVVLDDAYAARHMEVEPGEYILLTVSDNGVGMSDEVKARIFEPFFTTKEKDKGTGLGLATVFGIVKQNRGHIRVYSEPGQGTTFEIFLPHISETGAVPSTPSTGDAVPSGGSETLLLVEDEAPVRELTRDILIAQGYRVLTAMDGEGALQVAKGYEGPIHLLLADVVMPRLSGRALADQLRSSRPEMRVLFISGYTDDAIVHHGVLAEGTNFLSKPFGLEALARKVRSVLDA